MTAVDAPKSWISGPWTDNYHFRAKLGDGGQGYAFHAASIKDKAEVAIKVLKDRNKPKARRRMLREVNALHALSKTEALVPSFIESNINDSIEDPALWPYVVMEYIPGKTLLQAQQDRGPLSLKDAIAFTCILLDTIAIAHSEHTTHRDIKPQNIILKSNDYKKPYLIDFGLSFNRIMDIEDDLTSIRESIGNRFLTLPETEQTGSELKHEFASDFTLISGVLFFTLTNQFPEYLSRDLLNSPHRRHAEIIENMHGDNSAFLLQFFDRAFQYDVFMRFQSSEELRDRLQRLKDQSEGKLPDIDPIAVAKEIKEQVAAENRYYQLDAIEKQHAKSLDDFENYISALSNDNKLAPVKLTIEHASFGNREAYGKEVIRNSIRIITVKIPSYYKKELQCRYFLGVDGDEVAVLFLEEEKKKENVRKIRVSGMEKTPAPTPETLINCYEWEKAHTEFLKKHFANWFDQASRALILKTNET